MGLFCHFLFLVVIVMTHLPLPLLVIETCLPLPLFCCLLSGNVTCLLLPLLLIVTCLPLPLLLIAHLLLPLLLIMTPLLLPLFLLSSNAICLPLHHSPLLLVWCNSFAASFLLQFPIIWQDSFAASSCSCWNKYCIACMYLHVPMHTCTFLLYYAYMHLTFVPFQHTFFPLYRAYGPFPLSIVWFLETISSITYKSHFECEPFICKILWLTSPKFYGVSSPHPFFRMLVICSLNNFNLVCHYLTILMYCADFIVKTLRMV